MEQLPVTTVLP